MIEADFNQLRRPAVEHTTGNPWVGLGISGKLRGWEFALMMKYLGFMIITRIGADDYSLNESCTIQYGNIKRASSLLLGQLVDLCIDFSFHVCNVTVYSLV